MKIDFDDLQKVPTEKLRQLEDEYWELAGLARMDGDAVDEERMTSRARKCAFEIKMREGAVS